ncbi:hypothetical protein CPC08DRAFT_730502 [Agrocybe pediades]|nr:hypothetical protein CPC08DRAFT_730502 [Agrocybe pediades]
MSITSNKVEPAESTKDGKSSSLSLVTLGEQVGYFLPCSLLPQVKDMGSQGPVPHVELVNRLPAAQPGSHDAPIFVSPSAPTPPRWGTEARPIIVVPTPKPAPPKPINVPSAPKPAPPTYQRGICIRGRPAPCRFIRPERRPPPPSTPITPKNKNQRYNGADVPFPNGYDSTEEELEAMLTQDRIEQEKTAKTAAELRNRQLASYNRFIAIENMLKSSLPHQRPVRPSIIPFNLAPSSTASSSALSQGSLGSPFSTPTKKPSVTKACLQLVSPTLSWDGEHLLQDLDGSSDDEFYEAQSNVGGDCSF